MQAKAKPFKSPHKETNHTVIKDFIRHHYRHFNAAVIALKDYDGRVFVRGTKLGEATKAYVNAVPDLPGLVRDFKSAGHYVIARIAVFKDGTLTDAIMPVMTS